MTHGSSASSSPGRSSYATAGPTGGRHVRVLLHRRSDAVTAELGVDRVPRRAEARADGVRDVAAASPGSAAAIPALSARSVALDQRDARRRPCVAHDEADGRVRRDAVHADGEVEGQPVAVGERVVVRRPWSTASLTGRADVGAERARAGTVA